MSQQYNAQKLFVGKTHYRQTQYGEEIKLCLKIEDIRNLEAEADKQRDGECRVSIKKSRAGKWYSEISSWRPGIEYGDDRRQQISESRKRIHAEKQPVPGQGEDNEQIPF